LVVNVLVVVGMVLAGWVWMNCPALPKLVVAAW
jgi:hypothetical protein